jgi:hypothetical protein
MFAPELADTISGMDPKNFEMLAKVEAEHFWFSLSPTPLPARRARGETSSQRL